jgi:hypothetical protein
LELIEKLSKIDKDLWTTGVYDSIQVSKDKIPLKNLRYY